MHGDKQGLVRALNEMAVLTELHGANPFRSRAYERAARTLEGLDGQPPDWLERGDLEQAPGVGRSMVEKVEQWAREGKLHELEELRARTPAGLLPMLEIPGMGPKKIKQLWQDHGIDDLEKLEQGARDGTIAKIKGFGSKSAEKILDGIEQRRKYQTRHTLDVAAVAVQALTDSLRACKAVKRLEVGGSFRRRRETIKDIDLLATSDDPAAVMKAFIETPGVERVVAHGETRSSILLEGGVPADLRVVEDNAFAPALTYFTGNKDHNTALRGRAVKFGYKLNEYGLFGGQDETPIETPDEASIYKALELAYIEPELREDTGEIQAAEKGELPELIAEGDVRGVVHCHTRYSDGKQTVEQMALGARDAGYEYLCICDHSQSARYAEGLEPDDLERQMDEIDGVNEKLKGFRIFKGIESDILAEGELDYDDELLDRLDCVVVSIHSRFGMDEQAMTERVCRALEHPAAAILGHPTGRLLLRREPFALDLDRVFETAARHNVAIEINAHPLRLDLDWRYIRRAKAAGCIFAINPDAHDTDGIADIPYGVGVARKGWLGKDDVINTKTARAFGSWLKRRRG